MLAMNGLKDTTVYDFAFVFVKGGLANLWAIVALLTPLTSVNIFDL